MIFIESILTDEEVITKNILASKVGVKDYCGIDEEQALHCTRTHTRARTRTRTRTHTRARARARARASCARAGGGRLPRAHRALRVRLRERLGEG